MMDFKRESSLLTAVSSFVCDQSFHVQKRELQFFNYSIDLYAFSPQTRATIAIELKLKNWRRAFEQGILYQLCSDFVYVALPQKRIDSLDLNLFSSQGLGVIAVHDETTCSEVLAPKVSTVVRSYYRNDNISFLTGKNGQ